MNVFYLVMLYIAPGDKHLLLAKSGANYVTQLSDAPPVNRHKPVTCAFDSQLLLQEKTEISEFYTG